MDTNNTPATGVETVAALETLREALASGTGPELMTATREELEAVYPSQMASGKPFVAAVDSNEVGNYARIVQVVPNTANLRVKPGNNPFGSDRPVLVMRSVLLNIEDESKLDEFGLGQVFADATIVIVETLDPAQGFPILRVGQSFGHVGGQPVYQGHILDKKGTKDLRIEGVSFIGENPTKKDKEFMAFTNAIQRQGVLRQITPQLEAAGVFGPNAVASN